MPPTSSAASSLEVGPFLAHCAKKCCRMFLEPGFRQATARCRTDRAFSDVPVVLGEFFPANAHWRGYSSVLRTFVQEGLQKVADSDERRSLGCRMLARGFRFSPHLPFSSAGQRCRRRSNPCQVRLHPNLCQFLLALPWR